MDRPRVMINLSMTADGKIASARREYPRLTSELDRKRMDQLRAQSDAVLVGAGTVRSINPPLHVRNTALRIARRQQGKGSSPMQVVLTASGRVEARAKALREAMASARILVAAESAREDLPDLGDAVEIWWIGKQRVDLGLLLARLRDRGVETLLIEGGSETNAGFIEHDLVDDIYLTIAPTLLGGREAPTAVGGEGLFMSQRLRLILEEVEQEGDELFCHYRVAR